MLIFRRIDYAKDVEDIIDLLNANFQTHHTKEGFLWKHYQNPFGKSYGLLAIDGEKIVALRMFMRWEFYGEGKVVKAIRPVDTCTDHAHRGQGLFKKLTLQGLENIKSEYELIFNTPNSNSRPGYLKMGWREIGNNISYNLGIINFLKKGEYFLEIDSAEIGFRREWMLKAYYQTNISEKFLSWRYNDLKYKIAKSEKGSIVIFKIAVLKRINTLILVNSFGEPEEVNKLLRSVCKKNSTKIIYYLNNENNKALKFLFKFNRGNQVVVSKDDKYKIGGKINFSASDLEGRI